MYWTFQYFMYLITFVLFCFVITTCDTIPSVSSTSLLKTEEKNTGKVFGTTKHHYNEGTVDDQSVKINSNQSSIPRPDHEEVEDNNGQHWILTLLLIGLVFLITVFVIIIIKLVK